MSRRRFKLINAGLDEAPIDGTEYVRQDGGWVTLPAAGAEVNDLTAAVTWANIPIANVPTGTTSVTVALGDHLHTGVYEPADAAITKTDEAEAVTSLWNFTASGLGGTTDYDLTIGDVTTPDYGMLQIGNSVIGRTSYNVAALDLDGANVWRNLSAPATSNIEFAMVESGSTAIRFALAKAGVGNATYNPRSLIIAGPSVNDDTVVTVGYWQTQGLFHNLTMDTGLTGADLGVQNDLEVEGDIFTDSIKGSTDNTTIAIAPHGTGNVSLGNMTFDADQTIGVGQDNYVLTYDNAASTIQLEAVAAGGSAPTGTMVLTYQGAAGGDPGSGNWTSNNTTITNYQWLELDDLDIDGNPTSHILDTLLDSGGGHVVIQTADNSYYHVMSVDTVVDNVGYWRVNVTPLEGNGDATTIPTSTDATFTFYASAYVPVGTTTSTNASRDALFWDDADHFWEPSGQALRFNPATVPTNGRIQFATTSGFNTASPQMTFNLGVSQSCMWFVHGTATTDGLYSRIATSDSPTTYQIGVRDTSVNTPVFEVNQSKYVTVLNDGAFRFEERAAAPASAATYGSLWVKSDTPNTLWFTDDAGADIQLGGGVADGTSVGNNARDMLLWNDTTNAWEPSGSSIRFNPSSPPIGGRLQLSSTASTDRTRPIIDMEYGTSGQGTAWRIGDIASATDIFTAYASMAVSPATLNYEIDEISYMELRSDGNVMFEDWGSLKGFHWQEKATAATAIAGYGQIWVKNDVPNTLWFTDDAGSDFQLGTAGGSASKGASTGSTFAYDSTLSIADPGAGNFRMNSGLISVVSSVQFSITDGDSVNNKRMFDEMEDGSRIYFRNVTDGSQYRIFRVTATADNTTWYNFTGAFEDGTGSATTMTDTDVYVFDFYTTRGELDMGTSTVAGEHDIPYWDQLTKKWVSSGSNVRIGPGTNTDGRLYIGSPGTVSEQTPQIKLQVGGFQNRYNTFIEGAASSEGFYQYSNFGITNDSTIFGARTGSTNTDLYSLDIQNHIKMFTDTKFMIEERAAAATAIAGYGQIWVKTATPNELWFTDDAGTDFQLNAAGGASALADLSDVVSATNTNRFALMANGTTGYVGRAIVEADVSDLGTYLTSVAVTDLDNGTDGELITWDATGVAATVAVGTSGHVLTSNGTGAAPTFQAAAGGGGTIYYKTADETVNNSATMQNDDHFAAMTLDADSHYKITGSFDISTNTSADIKFVWTFTQTPQDWGHYFVGGHSTNGAEWGDSNQFNANVVPIWTGSNGVGAVTGYFRTNATTGGTFTLQWAQSVATIVNTTMLAGSWLKVEKIA